MKRKITALLLSALICLGSAVPAFAFASAENDIPQENTNYAAKALDIPNILGVGLAYPADDPEAPFQISVFYAHADQSGSLKVTLNYDIDIMELGASVQAAVIEGEYGSIAEDQNAGIEEHLNMGYYDDGMEYILAGSYYLLKPGAYFLWNVSASNACYIVVSEYNPNAEYAQDDLLQDDGDSAEDDYYTEEEISYEAGEIIDLGDTSFIPGNGIDNDVILKDGYRFEIRFTTAGTYTYPINGGTELRTEYLVWPDCELILPDNGERYELYSVLSVSGMGDTSEGGCTLYGGDSICFTDDRLCCDSITGTYYGEDYPVTLITESGAEVYFRVVLDDITRYIPDYYGEWEDEEDWNDAYPGEESDEPEETMPSVSFTDVPANEWYHDTVVAAAEASIIAGNADGSYNPNGELTWAQAVTFAVRLAQFRAGEHIYGAADQTDVWYDIYVDYANDRGIIDTTPENVNYIINRAEAALIFAAVLGDTAQINTVPDGYFSDVHNGGDVHDAVYALARAGIANGMGDGTFGVDKSFRRSQVAAIVARMAGLSDPAVIG